MMRLGEAAKALGVHPDTLRRLERRGLFSPNRDWKGHRRVTEADLIRLRSLFYPHAGSDRKPKEEKGA